MEKKQTNGSVNKVAAFLKRNIYYVMMIVCVLAIGAVVTTVAVLNTQGADIDAGGTPPVIEDPAPDPNPTPDPNPDVTPPVVDRDFILTMPVIGGELDREFNDTSLVMDTTLGSYRTHQAVDISGAVGSSIIAGFEGVVESVVMTADRGTVVTINHDNGYTSVYKLVDAVTVKKGDKVDDDTEIGKVGMFIFESGQDAHVHYELSKDGKLIDAMLFMLGGDK